MQVVPVGGSGDVSKCIGVVVNHHFRFSARAAGEVHEHVVVHASVGVAVHKRCGFPHAVIEIQPTLAHFGTDADPMLHGRTVGQRLVYMIHDIFIAAADDSFDSGLLASVNDVLGGEQEGGGNGDGSDFVQGEHRCPELMTALEDEHHHVAFSDAEALKEGCRAVALLFELSESVANLLVLVVGPEHGKLVGGLFCPSVHHVAGEIEVCRNFEFKVFLEIFQRTECRLL